MLRLITQWTEAQSELLRIRSRFQDERWVHKDATVREVVQAVQRQGDRALVSYLVEQEFQSLGVGDLRVGGSELDAAYQQVPKVVLQAIQSTAQELDQFHRQRIPRGWVQFMDNGVVTGCRYTPMERVGLYVSGGQVTYPSAVLMGAIPARVAGVSRVVLVTPPGPDGLIDPVLLVAAQEVGIEDIFRVGGAGAIAALAYGTATIPQVDLITGTGDIYVALAKRLVSGVVGVDGLMGPSTLWVVADGTANPVHLAADLLAQAEQDPMAAAILVTPEVSLAHQVIKAVEQQVLNHPRRTLVEKAIAHYGMVLVVESLEKGVELSNQYGPEYLMLALDDPWHLLGQVKHAGVVLLGYSSPLAVGDYLTVSSRGVPTGGAVRHTSALSVETFLKRTPIVHYSPQALQRIARPIDILSQVEQFPAHGDGVRLRLQSSSQEEPSTDIN